MKFAVIGGGSMGKRRIRCLLGNQIEAKDIRLVEVREDRLAEANKLYGVQGLANLNAALEWKADAVIISVPGAMHMEPCLAVARAGKPFFCEVPLSPTLDGVEELAALVLKNKIVAASGCQPPFHPLFKLFKQWIDDPTFGKPLALLTDFGQYLPDWHPYEDYRKFYASSQKMGGGNLDVIAQEMATIYWLLQDRITEVFCNGRHLSSLEIDGSDCWHILATTARGAALTMHFDMIQRAGRNMIKLISESGTIELDMVAGTIRRFLVATKQWETRTVPQGYVYEQSYIDEIKLFIQCINGDATWHNPLPVAIDIVKFLGAMLSSAERHVAEKV